MRKFLPRKKNFCLVMVVPLLAAALTLCAGCGASSVPATPAGSEPLLLSRVCVYGEHALFYAGGVQASLVFNPNQLRELNLAYLPEIKAELLGAPTAAQTAGRQATAATRPALSLGEQQQLAVFCGESVNQGLCLWQLQPGLYRFSSGAGRPLAVEDFAPLEGYTILREGVRKHWRFAAEVETGLLTLTIAEASELPAGYYDIYIDAGHGGKDTGATAFGRVEAAENREAALYFAARLEELGFVVAVSPFGQNIPDSGDNPYLPAARIDSIYRSHASYVISNHLNGGDGQDSGFQIYTSVRADQAWGEQIAQAFAKLGWQANNGNWGRVAAGQYKRWSRDNYHSGRDYYFILRETGGYALSPYRYLVHNDDMGAELRRGPEGILLEYLFLDNPNDLAYWDAHYQALIDAALAASLAYWQAE
jgi:N-acetylmuramoyl-L-alanine amidase